MKRVKEIYYIDNRKERASDFSTGFVFILDDGSKVETMTTDVIAERYTQEKKEYLEQMNKQIQSAGGSLTFVVQVDEEGWFAKCKEFPGIVTGGPNKNPTQNEVAKSIIDSVKTAFHIPICELSEHVTAKKQKAKTSVKTKTKFPKVTIERELQFT